ncbi:MAG: hypothetical protein RQ724_07910, partial [Desulfuromonadales bacterium]|nr:hypothetical protein [Desulfuromonadales bacterium]
MNMDRVIPKAAEQSYGYFSFLQAHPQILIFGVILTFFSSFGQTFLISIFVPQFLDVFALDT